MRRAAAIVASLALLAGSGCAQNAYTLQGQVQTLEQERTSLAQRNQELQARALSLDKDNQELETLLAQSRQQSRVLEDQVAALREQLSGTTAQLARLKTEREEASRRVETLEASAKRRVGATITANNSLEAQLPSLRVPGADIRADGDVIRVELPGGQLFDSGGARLMPQAGSVLDTLIRELERAYPQQMIGIEGHTDSDPIAGNRWQSNHQLSVARALAVYDYVAARSRLSPEQLFVVGHGANHPVASNGTPAGKERNRRVEVVVYPERAPGR